MAAILGNDPTCSVARSLEVLGDRWTLLIVRQAGFGDSRFSEFAEHLGIARNILADRLESLVSFGVMDRRPYRDEGERERFEYVLTASGRELVYVMGALAGWGDRNRPTAATPSRVYTDAHSGERLHLAFVTSEGREVASEDIRVVRPTSAPAAGAGA